MLQFTVQEPTAKRALLQLLDFAEQVLEHDVTINSCYLDDAELANAAAEVAFEAIRTAIRQATQLVDKTVD